MKISPMKLALCLGLAALCSAQDAPKGSPGEPLATVAGQPIYEQDLQATIGPKLLQLHNQEFQIKSSALQDVIRQKLLEAEAKRRGITTEKLQEEIDSKVTEPSDAEVRGYYLAVKNQLTQSFDEIKPQIQKALKALNTQQARQDFADSLRSKSEVVVLLHTPKVEVGYDAARVRGDPKAPITIVEFSDFQCPYCKQAQATLKDLLAKYNGRVKLAFRDFPMRAIHPRAQTAAEAARCAGEQGKFWEYHDALFADQSKLDAAGLAATAKSLGLDEKAFQSCLASGKFKPHIEADLEDGGKAGVAGTPGFFINGVFVSGSQPPAEYEKIIDSELAALGQAGPTRASR
jgi:protein-disulfide isomerase